MEFLSERAGPLLRERGQSLELTVFGAGWEQIADSLSDDPGLTFVSDGSRLQDICDESCLMVVLAGAGHGWSPAIAVAASRGLPWVLLAPPGGAEGRTLGDNDLVAQTPDNLVAHLARLSSDNDLWQQASEASQRLAEHHYGFEQGRARWRHTLEMAGVTGIAAKDPMVSSAGVPRRAS